MSGAQFHFFPIKARIEYPKTKMTADALGEVEAEDGNRYYVKSDEPGRKTRASEWLSTNLAESVGISAPTPAIIEMQDGALVFGSRRVAGVAEDLITQQILTTPSSRNTGQFSPIGLTRILSSIYALDMFLYNDDRHLGNYISYDDVGTRRFHAFDFSRCLFWMWPFNGYPIMGNTWICGQFLRLTHGFDIEAARLIVSRLGAISTQNLVGFINRMPSDWLDDPLRTELLSWWDGDGRRSRAAQLISGLDDGSLI